MDEYWSQGDSWNYCNNTSEKSCGPNSQLQWNEEDIRPLSDWGIVGFGGQLVIGNRTSWFKDDSPVSLLGSWLGEVQFSDIANIRGEILEAGLVAVLQTCLVSNWELKKEIWRCRYSRHYHRQYAKQYHGSWIQGHGWDNPGRMWIVGRK